MAKPCWLSTSDNPFNPFEKNNHAWDDWSRWDEDHGYYTTNLLMRAAYISPELSDVQNDEEIEIRHIAQNENKIDVEDRVTIGLHLLDKYMNREEVTQTAHPL